MCSSWEGEEGGAGRLERGESRLSRRLISSMSWSVGARWSSLDRPASKGASTTEVTDWPGLDCTRRERSSSRLQGCHRQAQQRQRDAVLWVRFIYPEPGLTNFLIEKFN
jgi:hypothetical protein